MSSSARMIRSRSLVGIARSARCAGLGRLNSQFMLKVFETHALAARVLFIGAGHRLDFLRYRVLDGEHSAALHYSDVSSERVAHDSGTGAVLVFAHAIEFRHQLRRQRYRYGLHVS